MVYEPFSIIVVPFPFTDLPKHKRRPAVVLSQKRYQEKSGHVTLLMITSAKHSLWLGDHEITDLKSTGLPVASLVRQKIFTVDIRLIEECIGRLSLSDKKAVTLKLHEHLAL